MTEPCGTQRGQLKGGNNKVLKFEIAYKICFIVHNLYI